MSVSVSTRGAVSSCSSTPPLVLGEIHLDVRLGTVVGEIDDFFGFALVFREIPYTLIVGGIRFVLGLIDDDIRFGAVFGHINFHIGFGFVVGGIDALGAQ